jgi:antitoxin (DNA-binding transcriptional repressor) of toxin-antitoxin stability system
MVVLAGPVFPAASAPPIPETPVGLVLGAWLEAHNSGDPARYESFVKTYPSWLTVDAMTHWRSETGEYDLLEVDATDRTNIFFRVKQKSSGLEEFGRLQVSAAEPRKVTTLDVRRVPPGAKVERITIDDAASARIVAQAAVLLDRFHVDPKIGKSLSAAMRKRAAHGDYRSLMYGEELARKLTKDLREVGQDKHLEVRFSYFILPAVPPARDAVADSRLRAANCGFEKAEHLRPNIGYLKFNFFGDPEICTATAGAAMNFLADSDALIIDLRDNNGGRGGVGTFIASYLFAERTQLSGNFRRADNVTTEEWTLPYVPGRKFIDKPVLVLISNRTFSAGEGFAYLLKDLKRATLIGETTVGGSGTIEFKPIDAHFTLVLPTGRVVSPVTKTDWAGTGVEPDVKVPADQALDAALKLAAEEISKAAK